MRRIPTVTAALAGAALIAGLAMAADGPGNGRKPEPPAYLATCPWFGAGLIRIPGHDTCMQLSGDILVEGKFDLARHDLYIETTRIGGNPVALYDKVRLGREIDRFRERLDARVNVLTATRIGGETLLTYVSLRSGQQQTTAEARGTTTQTSDLRLDQAWLKYAGITAGRHGSYFNFSPGYTFSGGYASQRTLNLVAYTHAFGKLGGVTFAAEDASERRVWDGVWSAYNGQRRPDFVVQGRLNPSWGVFHAAAATHQINDAIAGRTRNAFAFNSGLELRQKWSDLFGPAAGETYGRVLVSSAFTSGALDYLGIPKFGTDYASDVDGRIRMLRGRSHVVSYEHVWRPNFKTTFTWSSYDIRANFLNFGYRVRGSVAQAGAEYMPVPGLMFGVEANYFRDKARGAYFGVSANTDRVEIVTASAYMRRRF